jgi:hypothetical protein
MSEYRGPGCPVEMAGVFGPLEKPLRSDATFEFAAIDEYIVDAVHFASTAFPGCPGDREVKRHALGECLDHA